jgi:hypothetical protein
VASGSCRVFARERPGAAVADELFIAFVLVCPLETVVEEFIFSPEALFSPSFVNHEN